MFYLYILKELFDSIASQIAENCTVANSLPLFLKYSAKSLFFNRLNIVEKSKITFYLFYSEVEDSEYKTAGFPSLF